MRKLLRGVGHALCLASDGPMMVRGVWRLGAIANGKCLAIVMLLVTFTAPTGASATTVRPRATPSVYTTPNFGLTFRVPPSTTYCPLPDDWRGSDHGTILFLERPTQCGDAGFPSISRGYQPDDVPAISLFYGYWLEDDAAPAPACHQVGSILLLGAWRAVCETRKSARITRWVTAPYQADAAAEVTLALSTTLHRLSRDMVLFERTSAAIQTCRTEWTAQKKRFSIGVGKACPKGGRWF